MAADTLDVLSLAEAKTVLKITDTDVARDARLERVITAVSRRFDDEWGPIVTRTVPAATYEPACWDLWVDGPIYSTPAITITEYDRAGTAQLLTLETYDTKPTHGYRLEPRSGLGGGYTGRIRRTAGTTQQTWGTVRLTYAAGRYANTAAVHPVFKEAASVVVDAWWEQVRPHVEDDLPTYVIPADVMAQAMTLIPVDEKPGRSVLA